jgi:hypothetical protein
MEELFGRTVPSVIKDPFDACCINQIAMFAIKSSIYGTFSFSGSVKFKNGSTEGTQNFEANNLGELYMKVAEFCQSLERR